MGAAVPGGVSSTVQDTKPDDLDKAVAELSKDQRDKLVQALQANSNGFDKLWPQYEAKMKAGGPESFSDAATVSAVRKDET